MLATKPFSDFLKRHREHVERQLNALSQTGAWQPAGCPAAGSFGPPPWSEQQFSSKRLWARNRSILATLRRRCSPNATRR